MDSIIISPDLSIGIKFEALISALPPGLNSEFEVRNFFADLETWEPSKAPKLEKPLIFEPTKDSTLTFPFAVVGQTGEVSSKWLAKAEDAALTMACAHRILLDLDTLTAGILDTSAASNRDTSTAGNQGKATKTRVLFSITVHGSIHEIWTHWTARNPNAITFHSARIYNWTPTVLDDEEQALEWFTKVNNVCVWGLEQFKHDIVKRLEWLATRIHKERENESSDRGIENLDNDERAANRPRTG